MEAIIERAAGLDVHQGSVVACVIIGAAGHRASRETRTFGAMRQTWRPCANGWARWA